MNISSAFSTFDIVFRSAVPVFTVALGFLVWWRNKRSTLHIAFAVLCFFPGLWLVSRVLLRIAGTPDLALVASRFENVAVAFIGPSFYLFVVAFLGREREKRRYLIAVYSASVVLAAIALFTDWITATPTRLELGSTQTYYTQHGFLGPALFLLLLASGIVALIHLLREHRANPEGFRRQQTRFFAIAMGIGLLASIDFLPSYGIRVYPIGHITTLLSVLVLAYAIARERVLDVRFLTFRVFLWAALTFLLAATIHAVVSHASILAYVRAMGPGGYTLISLAAFGLFTFYVRKLKPLLESFLFRAERDTRHALARFLKEISEYKDVAELSGLVPNTIRTTLQIRNVRMYVRDTSAQDYVVAHTTSRRAASIPEEEIDTLELHNQPGIIDWADLFLFPRYRGNRDRLAALMRRLRTRLLIPLSFDGRLLGFVTVGRKPSRTDFTRNEADFLDTIRRETSIALNNAIFVHQRIQELSVLYELGRDITSVMPPQELYDNIIEKMSRVLEFETCSLMLRDKGDTGMLTIQAAIGLDPEIVSRARVRMGEGIAGHVAATGRPLLVENIEKDPRFRRRSSSHYSTKSLISLPLSCAGDIIGVLNVNNKKTGRPFTTDDLHLLSIFANQIAICIENSHLYSKIEKGYLDTITALARAIEANDAYTRGHSDRVTLYSIQIAKKLGFSRDDIKMLQYAAVLHDIGKIGITSEILNKPARLTEQEFAVIRQHPIIGADIIQNIEFLEPAVEIVRFHHERVDGSGYPFGKAADSIPLPSRIICVADSYDAMTTDRPYRKALSIDEAINELHKCSGSQFDGKLVEAFIDFLGV